MNLLGSWASVCVTELPLPLPLPLDEDEDEDEDEPLRLTLVITTPTTTPMIARPAKTTTRPRIYCRRFISGHTPMIGKREPLTTHFFLFGDGAVYL